MHQQHINYHHSSHKLKQSADVCGCSIDYTKSLYRVITIFLTQSAMARVSAITKSYQQGKSYWFNWRNKSIANAIDPPWI
jgi:hypothetical protein